MEDTLRLGHWHGEGLGLQHGPGLGLRHAERGHSFRDLRLRRGLRSRWRATGGGDGAHDVTYGSVVHPGEHVVGCGQAGSIGDLGGVEVPENPEALADARGAVEEHLRGAFARPGVSGLLRLELVELVDFRYRLDMIPPVEVLPPLILLKLHKLEFDFIQVLHETNGDGGELKLERGAETTLARDEFLALRGLLDNDGVEYASGTDAGLEVRGVHRGAP